MSKHDFYYKFAVASTALSALTTVSLLVAVPLLCNRTNTERFLMEQRAEKFRVETNRIWAELKPGPADPKTGAPIDGAIYYSLKQKRSPWEKQICQGCNQLNCPGGAPGNPGPPGDDGNPGDAGMPGRSGEDGLDVELAPEDDLPCVICPGGPPGMR